VVGETGIADAVLIPVCPPPPPPRPPPPPSPPSPPPYGRWSQLVLNDEDVEDYSQVLVKDSDTLSVHMWGSRENLRDLEGGSSWQWAAKDSENGDEALDFSRGGAWASEAWRWRRKLRVRRRGPFPSLNRVPVSFWHWPSASSSDSLILDCLKKGGRFLFLGRPFLFPFL